MKPTKLSFQKNNKIRIITDGKEKFKLLFEDIKNAKQYIHIQYYILKKDGIGKQLFSLLEQKLKRRCPSIHSLWWYRF